MLSAAIATLDYFISGAGVKKANAGEIPPIACTALSLGRARSSIAPAAADTPSTNVLIDR
jgi:hypothetical protein